jgi:hypothetical protein
MHNYDVHKCHYQISEIHSPWIRGSGHRAGPIWPYSEDELNAWL